MANSRWSRRADARKTSGPESFGLAWPLLAAGVSTVLVGARSLANRRAKKSVALGARKLAVDAAKELHERPGHLQAVIRRSRRFTTTSISPTPTSRLWCWT